VRRLFALVAIAGALGGCPSRPLVPPGGAIAGATPACGGLDGNACGRARGLLSAASAFSDVKHEIILDPTSSFAPGRGVQRGEDGTWSATTTACARPHARPSSTAAVDATTIDFGFVGVAVDSVLLAADADLGTYIGGGASASMHRLRLVAIAYVRDLDPQFFDATDDVSYADAACACGRATHFVGAVKMGGMLSYEIDVRAGEVHGRGLDFFRARLEANDARVAETRVGGLEVEGLDAALRGVGGAAGALSFRVPTPVPIAYAVYPVADVCKLAFPEPEITPAPLDFGEVAYGASATRLMHVVNRASIDLFAHYQDKIIDVPAYASLDIQARWAPQGEATGCEALVREEAIVFTPRDPRAPVTPKQRSVRVVEQVRAGRPNVVQRVHVDTGESRAPDYAKTIRDVACPADYVVAACRTENAQCGNDGGACVQNGYALTSTMSGNGCHFGCSGPSAILPFTPNYCRFDAVAECRLRCAR
jgi:hypothetical protein